MREHTQGMVAYDELMSPADVAAVFGVDPKTVTRWAKAGKLACIRTPGGHRRFKRADVEALLRPPDVET